jgi:1-phosphatidylinositol phosphodiesterase
MNKSRIIGALSTVLYILSFPLKGTGNSFINTLSRLFIIAVSASFVHTAWAHNNDAYYHPFFHADDEAVANYANWMSRLDDEKLLSELSLPGTHDTMARCKNLLCFPLDDIAQTQSMTLLQQLNSGIRVLDIRVNYERVNSLGFLVACENGDTGCVFAIYHGLLYQGETFISSVLNVVIDFLNDHPSESIVMRIKEEGGDNLLFNDAMKAILAHPYYSQNILKKTCNPSNVNIAVKLGTGEADCDARGKFAVLRQWKNDNVNGEAHPESIGRWGSLIPSAQKQDDYSVTTNWDLHSKWEKIKTHLNTADNDSSDNKLYANFLSASGGSFPYFIASGHSSPTTGAPRLATGAATPFFSDSKYPDFPRVTCLDLYFVEFCTIAFEGTNILTKNCLNGATRDEKTAYRPCDGEFDRVGMIFADFPGKGLIEAIANVNLNDGAELGGPNLPPVAALSESLYIGNEGSTVEFDASVSSDPNGDSLSHVWDLSFFPDVCTNNASQAIVNYADAFDAWFLLHMDTPLPDQAFQETEEGMNLQMLVDMASQSTSTNSYTCLDNGSGDVTVTVTDGLLSSVASASVRIDNVAPTITAAGSVINENGVAVISGTIDDPGTQDTFDVVLDWGDGTNETFTRPASTTGTQTFERTHLYLDDEPTGTPADDYTVSINVVDVDDGEGIGQTTVTVNNVDPVAVIDAIVDEAGNVIGQDVDIALVGLELGVTASFTDIGTLDTHTVTFNWGDGTVNVGSVGAAVSPVSATHTYLTIGTYTVLVTVVDDDTGEDTVSRTIQVVDAAGAVTNATERLNEIIANDPTLDPEMAELIRAAVDKLRGDDGGVDKNGALDKFEISKADAALLKLSQAIELLIAEGPSHLISQLALTAKAAVIDLITKARESATKESEFRKITAAEAEVAMGDIRLQEGDALAAVDAYRDALKKL